MLCQQSWDLKLELESVLNYCNIRPHLKHCLRLSQLTNKKQADVHVRCNWSDHSHWFRYLLTILITQLLKQKNQVQKRLSYPVYFNR